MTYQSFIYLFYPLAFFNHREKRDNFASSSHCDMYTYANTYHITRVLVRIYAPGVAHSWLDCIMFMLFTT